ncbi:hypothetical protein BIW11_04145 [Tropilaelaps mercedesae]|uniref:Uncharacterized protein n=1 Tax=Tropilaelaps mercedesae TaxID=418985 RepID=A0A1V9XAC2_9ACAR|nr:hypothetical protein BIW11_04145 [Tropilaelaps mercedesae]
MATLTWLKWMTISPWRGPADRAFHIGVAALLWLLVLLSLTKATFPRWDMALRGRRGVFFVETLPSMAAVEASEISSVKESGVSDQRRFQRGELDGVSLSVFAFMMGLVWGYVQKNLGKLQASIQPSRRTKHVEPNSGRQRFKTSPSTTIIWPSEWSCQFPSKRHPFRWRLPQKFDIIAASTSSGHRQGLAARPVQLRYGRRCSSTARTWATLKSVEFEKFHPVDISVRCRHPVAKQDSASGWRASTRTRKLGAKANSSKRGSEQCEVPPRSDQCPHTHTAIDTYTYGLMSVEVAPLMMGSGRQIGFTNEPRANEVSPRDVSTRLPPLGFLRGPRVTRLLIALA